MEKRGVLFGIIVLVLAGIAAVPVFGQECGVLIKEPEINQFVLVVDRSGSMKGGALDYAKAAVVEFLLQVKRNDRVAVIDFGDDINVTVDFTDDKRRLADAVYTLRPRGGTRFYDAIVRAVQLLNPESGVKAIIYLTDGMDNRSKHQLRHIKSMNIGEGVFVYGVGLGDLDHDALQEVSVATNGLYRDASDSNRLPDIYKEVVTHHYEMYEKNYATKGSFVITSIPPQRPLYINGQETGKTPAKIDGYKEGVHTVEVEFERGLWACVTEAKAGYRTVIDARESDLPTDLYIESLPRRCSVFIDGEYVGMTAMIGPLRQSDKDPAYSNQLMVPSLPPGRHTMQIIASPEHPIGLDLEFEFFMPKLPSHMKVELVPPPGKVTLNDREIKVPAFSGF